MEIKLNHMYWRASSFRRSVLTTHHPTKIDYQSGIWYLRLPPQHQQNHSWMWLFEFDGRRNYISWWIGLLEVKGKENRSSKGGIWRLKTMTWELNEKLQVKGFPCGASFVNHFVFSFATFVPYFVWDSRVWLH